MYHWVRTLVRQPDSLSALGNDHGVLTQERGVVVAVVLRHLDHAALAVLVVRDERPGPMLVVVVVSSDRPSPGRSSDRTSHRSRRRSRTPASDGPPATGRRCCTATPVRSASGCRRRPNPSSRRTARAAYSSPGRACRVSNSSCWSWVAGGRRSRRRPSARRRSVRRRDRRPRTASRPRPIRPSGSRVSRPSVHQPRGSVERLGLVVPRAGRDRRGVVPFAGRGVHQGAVALLLQVAARGVEIRDERVRGARPRTRAHRACGRRATTSWWVHTVPPSAARQVVPAVDLVQVRALDELDVVAHPDRAGRLRLQLHRLDVELGQRDAVERMLVFTVIPGLLHQVLAAVVVMEQAGVEAHAVDANRTGPRAVDVLGGGQVVGAVLERAVDDLHVGVDQPELAVGG